MAETNQKVVPLVERRPAPYVWGNQASAMATAPEGRWQQLVDFFGTPQDLTSAGNTSVIRAPADAQPAAPQAAPAAAMPASLTFGSAMSALPAGTTASGNLSFSPVMEYTPEQLRVKSMAKSLAGMPPQMFQQMMSAMPARPASPSEQDMARSDYRQIAMANYMDAMQNATSREEQLAAQQSLLESLVQVFGGNPLFVPVAEGG